MNRERSYLIAAKQIYVEESRRANRRYVNRAFLGIPHWVRTGSRRFYNEEKHIATPKGARLGRARAFLVREAARVAKNRFEAARPVARARQEARMSLAEEKLTAVTRRALSELLKTKKRQAITAASALALASLLYFTPLGTPLWLKLGAVHANVALGTLAGVVARILGGYSPYFYFGPKYGKQAVGTDADVLALASRYAKARQFASDASVFGGIGVGFGTSALIGASSETLAQSVVSAREHLLHAIETKKGMPEYLPANGAGSTLVESSLVDTARKSSFILNGLHERIALLREEKFLLLNSSANKNLLADGVTLLERLKMLESARVRYEMLAKSGTDSNVTTQFLEKSLSDLENARLAVKLWSDTFDKATNSAIENFRNDHNKSLATLSAEYLGTRAGTSSFEPHTDLFPAPSHIEDLALTSGSLSEESFSSTAFAVSMRLHKVDQLLDQYSRIVANDDSRYSALLASRAQYQKLLNDLDSLRPFFDNFRSIKTTIGDFRSPTGENLAESLLRERIRQIDFSTYSDSWHAVVDASQTLARIKPGTVLVEDVVTPLKSVVSFKEGALPYFPQAMSRTIHEINQSFIQQGLPRLLVTEGHPALAYHVSACHQNGTCSDFTFSDRQFTPKRILKVFQIVNKPGAGSVIWEGDSIADRNRMAEGVEKLLIQGGMSLTEAHKLVEEKIKYFEWTTGAHFHFQCQNCEPATAPTPLVAGNDNARAVPAGLRTFN